jgi:hypothetical protein
MAGPSDEELRRRLEDAAPLLEATRSQYRALVPALHSWSWRQRLRSLAPAAREALRADEQVVRALLRAQRRAASEEWPEGEVRQLLEEVAALRSRLDQVVTRRLERVEPLAVGLQCLLRQVVGVPRRVALGERDPAAQEALEIEPELIASLQRFGAAVENLFGRPLTRGQRLPFTLGEFDALQAEWAAGKTALVSGWTQVARIDTSGGVERELTRRSKRAPKGTAGLPGPRALVHASFWYAAAAAHQQTILDERFAPVRLTPSEQTAAMRFLLARERDGAARFEVEGPRAALLMLAHELTASPEGRAPLTGGRAQVSQWAEKADALAGEDDWRRLRDGLRALAGRSVGLALPPLYRVGRRAERTPLPERLTDFFPQASGG